MPGGQGSVSTGRVSKCGNHSITSNYCTTSSIDTNAARGEGSAPSFALRGLSSNAFWAKALGTLGKVLWWDGQDPVVWCGRAVLLGEGIGGRETKGRGCANGVLGIVIVLEWRA